MSLHVAPKLSNNDSERMAVLDGWRGISILCVLACHMLPLGPKSWRLNEMFGSLGMSLFFTLSGFLITVTLDHYKDIRVFFVRRLCRILPLVYLYVTLMFIFIIPFDFDKYLAHLLFLINYEDFAITPVTSHLWSVCVEIHFYLFIGIAAGITGYRLRILIPSTLMVILLLRYFAGIHIAIVTHFRVDEILTGSCLALLWLGKYGEKPKQLLSQGNFWAYLAILLVSCHPLSGCLNYTRGIWASLLVGYTLTFPPRKIYYILSSRPLKYIATISYALYVIHPVTRYGWFDDSNVIIKYLFKRPISFAITFAAAHFSTYYYEQRWINYGKTITQRWKAKIVQEIKTESAISNTQM